MVYSRNQGETGTIVNRTIFYRLFDDADEFKSILENIRSCQDLGIFHNEGSSLFSARSTGWTDAKMRPCRRLDDPYAGWRVGRGKSSDSKDRWRGCWLTSRWRNVKGCCYFPISQSRSHLSYGWHWHCSSHRFVLQRGKSKSRVTVTVLLTLFNQRSFEWFTFSVLY